MPTYNRAAFLVKAFASIGSQALTDWELIVVDDGSSDESQQVIARLSKSVSQSVRYVYQLNAGPGAARNTGIELASGRYIAFFDSDDEWMPSFLDTCVRALEDNPEVDCVYTAFERREVGPRNLIQRNSFYPNETPSAFLGLKANQRGELRIISDDRIADCLIRENIGCAMKNCVFRRAVFDELRLPPFRIGEDRAFIICTLKAGFQFGYIDRVLMTSWHHSENTSAAVLVASVERRRWIQEELIRSYEYVRRKCALRPAERRSLEQRIAKEYFWGLGYAIFWESGCERDAFRAFRTGIRLDPLRIDFWKTYSACLVKAGLRRLPKCCADRSHRA